MYEIPNIMHNVQGFSPTKENNLNQIKILKQTEFFQYKTWHITKTWENNMIPDQRVEWLQ